MMPEFPDIAHFAFHKVIDDIDIDGTVVPGLRGTFYRRPADGGLESVGVYHYRDHEVLRAWGYVGERHCRYTAVRRADGAWADVQAGCPHFQVLYRDGEVTGLRLRTGDGGDATYPLPVD